MTALKLQPVDSDVFADDLVREQGNLDYPGLPSGTGTPSGQPNAKAQEMQELTERAVTGLVGGLPSGEPDWDQD